VDVTATDARFGRVARHLAGSARSRTDDEPALRSHLPGHRPLGGRAEIRADDAPAVRAQRLHPRPEGTDPDLRIDLDTRLTAALIQRPGLALLMKRRKRAGV